MAKTFKPQKLTLKLVRRKAREAYKARKLTAQHRDPAKRECAYVIGTYHCAIGAALSEETLTVIKQSHFNTGAGLDNLWNSEIIDVRASEFDEIERIQNAHDDWARAAQNGYDSVKERRNDFLKLIGLSRG